MASTKDPLQIKNRRLKVSPSGIITLPAAARKTLGMKKGVGARVSISINDGAVEILPAQPTGGSRVSPEGQMELRGEAKSTLAEGLARHYWLELNDDAKTVKLVPYRE